MTGANLEIHPVTRDRWADLLRLVGDRGAFSGCWCMWWRVTSAEFAERAGAGNRRSFKRLVDQEREPGLLGYSGGEPVGWVSVAPRDEFGRLDRSPVLGRVDDEPVWSIVCFYIDRRHRRKGVGAALLRGAVEHAASRGARVVEGYPIDTGGEKMPGAEVFTGLLPMFEAAGFRVVERRRPRRPIVRFYT